MTISCKAWNSPAEYPCWVGRCHIKGSVSTVLNPIFWKKVQGQKHPGRWGIVEHQILSIKVLFKTNAKGHKHQSNRLLSKRKTQLVNQRKQKVAFSPGTAHSPEITSYRTWWGAASPILNDTPVVYIYTPYNGTHIRNVYIYIYINTELLDGNQSHQEETHHPTHRFKINEMVDLSFAAFREGPVTARYERRTSKGVGYRQHDQVCCHGFVKYIWLAYILCSIYILVCYLITCTW